MKFGVSLAALLLALTAVPASAQDTGGAIVGPARADIYYGVGDEVIYPNPGFPIYESQIRAHGAVPVPLHLREARDFAFDPADLERLITPKTRLLILKRNNAGYHWKIGTGIDAIWIRLRQPSCVQPSCTSSGTSRCGRRCLSTAVRRPPSACPS